MARHQHGASLAGQGPEEAAHPDDALGVETVERFVQHQDGRIAQHGGRQAQALAHPEREPAGLASRDGLKARLLDHLGDPRTRQALRVGQPQQVMTGRPAGLQGGRIEQRAQIPHRVQQAAVRPSADECVSLIGRVQAENDAHRRRLAGPVGPDKPGHLPRVGRERHPVQRHGGAEALAHAINFHCRIHDWCPSVLAALCLLGYLVAMAAPVTRAELRLLWPRR